MSADVTERLIAEWTRGKEDELRTILDATDSPIERAFVVAMMLSGWEVAREEDCPEVWDRLESRIGPQIDPRAHSHGNGVHLLVSHLRYDAIAAPQVSLDLDGRKMRLDIAIIGTLAPYITKVAVELDGHDFHEKTKEQAKRDKSRDRLLQLHGWKVLRFSGSEVWRDAKGCVDETHDVFEAEGDLALCAQARARFGSGLIPVVGGA